MYNSPTFLKEKEILNFEIESYQNDINYVKNIKKIDNDQRKTSTKILSSLRAKIKTRLNAQTKLENLDIPIWTLFRILIELDGTVWNENQTSLWFKHIVSYEGKGEASLRDYYNLSPTTPTQNSIDIPELMIESKCIHNIVNSKDILQSIQPGKSGRMNYCKWVLNTAEQGMFVNLTEQTRDNIGIGEINKSTNLPENIHNSLFDVIKPSIIFKIPNAICLTSQYGFLCVERKDYDIAFIPQCITKCSPKYIISKEYIKNRITNYAKRF